MDPRLEDVLTSARSDDVDERTDAAVTLVLWIGDERADAALLNALEDPDDTAPVFAAAEALLECATPVALRLFALGWARADDQTGDWMADALRFARSSGAVGRDSFEGLLADDNEEVRDGARSILDWMRP